MKNNSVNPILYFILILAIIGFFSILYLTNFHDNEKIPPSPKIPVEIAVMTCYGDTLFYGKVKDYNATPKGITYTELNGKTTTIISNTITTIHRNKIIEK